MDKILFFDIDGTLGQHGVITESNLKALHLLKEKGYKLAICSNASKWELDVILRKLEVNDYWQFS